MVHAVSLTALRLRRPVQGGANSSITDATAASMRSLRCSGVCCDRRRARPTPPAASGLRVEHVDQERAALVARHRLRHQRHARRVGDRVRVDRLLDCGVVGDQEVGTLAIDLAQAPRAEFALDGRSHARFHGPELGFATRHRRTLQPRPGLQVRAPLAHIRLDLDGNPRAPGGAHQQQPQRDAHSHLVLSPTPP
jgi:hypothetical protein